MMLNLRPALQSKSLSTSAPYFKGTGSWDGLEIRWQAWIDLCSNKGMWRVLHYFRCCSFVSIYFIYFLRFMCIPQQYINLVSVVERFFVHPLYRKRIIWKVDILIRCQKTVFPLPWRRPFLFVRKVLCYPIRMTNFSVSCFCGAVEQLCLHSSL